MVHRPGTSQMKPYNKENANQTNMQTQNLPPM